MERVVGEEGLLQLECGEEEVLLTQDAPPPAGYLSCRTRLPVWTLTENR